MAKAKQTTHHRAPISKMAESLRNLAHDTEYPITSTRDYDPYVLHGIAFYLPEGSRFPPDLALSTLLARKDYERKFSVKYLSGLLLRIFSSLLSVKGFDLEASLSDLFEKLDCYSEDRLVFIRVEGIFLHGMCFFLGRVRLCPGDEELLQEILEATDRITDLTLHSEEEKLYFKSAQRQRLQERLKGACIALIKLNAEPIRAIEIAKEEVRRSMDLLRLGVKATHRLSQDIRIGIAGDHSSAVVEALSISESSVNTDMRRVGSPLRIDPAFLHSLEALGIFRMSEALANQRCTNLEEVILRSIHWFSVASCQDDKSNTYLLLVVSLETLFKQPQGASIASTVAEGAAFLLGKTKEERLEISKLVRKFYGIRSSVAHSGRSSFSELDLNRLMFIVLNAILEVVSRAGTLRSQDELSDAIELIKFA